MLPNIEKRGNLNFSTATSCGSKAVACRTHGVARARLCKGSALRSAPASRGFGLDSGSARASEQLWRPLNIHRRCPDSRVFK